MRAGGYVCLCMNWPEDNFGYHFSVAAHSRFWMQGLTPFWSSSHKLRGLANGSKDLSISTHPMALGLWAHAIVPSFVLVCLSTMGFKESNSGPHADKTLYQELSPGKFKKDRS